MTPAPNPDFTERLAALVSSLADPILMMDTGGIVLHVNSAVQCVLGYEQSEIVGEHISKLLPTLPGAELDRSPAGMLAAGVGKVIGNPLEIGARHRDGSSRPVRLTVTKFESGGQRLLAGTMHDISAEREALRDLGKSEEKYRYLVERAPVCIHEISLEGRLTSMNPSGLQMIDMTEAQVCSLDYLEFVGPQNHERIGALLQHANDGESSTFEFTVDTDDGPRTFSSCFVPIFDPDGSVARVMGITEDVTSQRKAVAEQLRLESQLLHTQKLESLGVLAGGIAHDFNNLLMGVLGNASMALEEAGTDDRMQRYLVGIESTAIRAAELCKQLLAYAGKGRFEIKPIDLSTLVEEMGHMLQLSISKTVVLRYDLKNKLPRVEVDASQIRQIVMNLITNASDAIGDRSGAITLATGTMELDRDYLTTTFVDDELASGFYVYVEVTDTGCGMDPSTVDRIFDPFYSTKATGRGLGLAAVLGIVRGHKGAIKCYSEPGQGTTFKVLLPASEAAIEDETIQHADGSAWRSEGLILIVDDDETVRTVARDMLQRVGFDVIMAEDGRRALEVFRGRRDEIRLVLLDMVMPHLGGAEVFRELRRIRENLCVVLTSGYNEQEATNLFTGKGLAGFIQKPFRSKDLLLKIREVLGG